MLRPIVLVVSLLVATPALADGLYFTESWGGADIHDELAARLESAMNVRISVGWRHGRWAVEGFLQGDIALTGDQTYTNEGVTSLSSAGVTVKYLQPIARKWDVYLRGSASRAWLDGLDGNYGGRGLGVGAGIQLKGKVPALGLLFWPLLFVPKLPGPRITGALFADMGADFYRLHRNGDLANGDAIDASVNRLTFGFALGSDF